MKREKLKKPLKRENGKRHLDTEGKRVPRGVRGEGVWGLMIWKVVFVHVRVGVDS